METKNITDFWNWFKTNSKYLEPKKITDDYIDELDKHLEDLADFSWEIGFDDRVKKYFLAISPEGDLDLFERSKIIISHAPIIEDWIFYPAKPPKKWKLIFDVFIDGEKVRFDASTWKYILYRFDDGIYDIVIKIPTSYKPYEDHFDEIGMIAVSGELGEAFVIEYVNEIELVYEFEDNLKGSDFITLKTKITS